MASWPSNGVLAGGGARRRWRRRTPRSICLRFSKIRQVALTRNSKKSPRAREHDRPEGVRRRRHAGAPPDAAASVFIGDYGCTGHTGKHPGCYMAATGGCDAKISGEHRSARVDHGGRGSRAVSKTNFIGRMSCIRHQPLLPSPGTRRASGCSSIRPLTTNYCAQKTGPTSSCDAFSALAMPHAPLPGRRHWAMPMPAHSLLVRLRLRGAAKQNHRRDRPAPTKAHL